MTLHRLLFTYSGVITLKPQSLSVVASVHCFSAEGLHFSALVVIVMGTVVPMSKVEGSWTWLSGLCNTALTYMYHDNVF